MKDREALHAAIHGVAKSRIQLSDRTTTKSYTLNYSEVLNSFYSFDKGKPGLSQLYLKLSD